MKILQIAKIVVGYDDRRNASLRFDAIISVPRNFPFSNQSRPFGKQIWNMSHPREFFIAFWNTLGRFEYLVGPKQAFLFWAAYAGPLLVDSSTQFWP